MSTVLNIDPLPGAPDSREREALALRACADIASGLAPLGQARDCEEASLFRAAADVLRSAHPAEAGRLHQAAERHFGTHACAPISAPVLIAHGKLISLPRLRDMLGRALKKSPDNP
jgi:hypothetical protein